MRIFLAAVFTTVMSMVTVADDTNDNYSARVQQEIERLEKDYVKFQKKPPYRRIKNCKEIVRGLLESADTAEKQRILAQHFCTSMAKSKRFRFYDYYVLWLGRGKILQYAQDKKVLLSLVAKVNSRDLIDVDKEIRLELCAFAINDLMAMVTYPRTEEIVALSKLEFDSEKWEDLSEWIKDNYCALQFNEKEQRFFIPIAQKKRDETTNKK